MHIDEPGVTFIVSRNPKRKTITPKRKTITPKKKGIFNFTK